MKIKFCGAATGVTGSCHLVSTDTHRVLLDCGMFQGGKAEEAKNRERFPFSPSAVECVIVSHSHIDHIGRLPLLVKSGFNGPIYASDATADLMKIMLLDSAHIQEQDAQWDSKRATRAGKPPVEPLYNEQDVEDTLKLVVPKRYNQLFEINDQMKVCFNDAGHILGSAIVELWTEENERTSKLVFTGDLGMSLRPILEDPTKIKKADYVVMETTYGDRLHDDNVNSVASLQNIIQATVKRGGNVVIPSFAVGRTQELLYQLNLIYDDPDNPLYKTLRDVPVFVDSPMCVEATQVFFDNAQSFDEEAKQLLFKGDHPLDFEGLHYSRTSDESKRINVLKGSKIIISASGMCDAGRIRHHLKHNLWNPVNSVVFVGYQAEGSLGRRLVEGAKTVTLFGEEINVAAEIYNLDGFSGHADKNGLMDWLDSFQTQPSRIFLVHGEPQSKKAFAESIRSKKGWDAVVVDGYNEYYLDDARVMEEDTPEQEFVSGEELDDVKQRIAAISTSLDDVLFNTKLAIDEQVGTDKLINIKNTVADLEKSLLSLSSTLTQEESEERGVPEDGETAPGEE